MGNFEDHPSHTEAIMNGLWGIASTRNRRLANRLFKTITDHFLASRYNPNQLNTKGSNKKESSFQR